MNAHFPTYTTELPASHSPSPENGVCYTNLSESGGSGGAGGGGTSVCSTAATTSSNSPPNIAAHSNGISVSGSNVDSMNGNTPHHQQQQQQQHHHQHHQQQQQQQQHLHHQQQLLHGPNCIPATTTMDGQPNFHHLNNNNNNNCAIKLCAGCGGKIVERFFLHALDRYWHNSCLKCYCCGAMLADIGSSCYTRAGMILCKPDYSRMFGTAPCSACGQTIAPNEFVMRTTAPTSSNQHHQQQQQQQQKLQNPHSAATTPGPTAAGNLAADSTQRHFPTHSQQVMPIVEHHVYHLKCFACSKCTSQLRPGDRYYMLSGSLVCEQDWLKLLKATNASPPVRKGKVGRPRRTKD